MARTTVSLISLAGLVLIVGWYIGPKPNEPLLWAILGVGLSACIAGFVGLIEQFRETPDA